MVKLAHERGKTVIITSHERDMIQEVCERVAIMHHGKLLANKSVQELIELFSQECYEIKLSTHLSEYDQALFEGLSVSPWEKGSLLSGAVGDQDKLHQILEQICQRKLPLVSVNRVEPNLEDVFVSLITETERELS